jgi:5'-3' exonuclease
MGDSSDNVPGVPGVGAKGALALIQQYGSVESVLQNAQEVRIIQPIPIVRLETGLATSGEDQSMLEHPQHTSAGI